MADFTDKNGTCLQSGHRPCIVVSNRNCNKYAKFLTVVPLSTKEKRMHLPTHIKINIEDVRGYLPKNSVAYVEQVTPIDKNNVFNKISYIKVDSPVYQKINEALKIQVVL